MVGRIEYSVGESDTRPWGQWAVLAVGEGYIIKQIDVLPGKILSLQSHEHRREHWTILSGQAEATIDDHKRLLGIDDTVFIERGQKHRIQNVGKSPMSFIEIQTGKVLEETDITRFSDEYGRVE